MTTPAANVNNLVTLARLKSLRNQSGTKYDDQLQAAANYASAMIENYCHRQFMTRTYTAEFYDIPPNPNSLSLKNYPIVSITTLTDGLKTYTAADYYLKNAAGIIILKDGASFTGASGEVIQQISATYSAGYDDTGADGTFPIPEELKSICESLTMKIFEMSALSLDHSSNVQAEDQLTLEEISVLSLDINTRMRLNVWKRVKGLYF